LIAILLTKKLTLITKTKEVGGAVGGVIGGAIDANKALSKRQS